MYEDIRLYPSTALVRGQITYEEYVEQTAMAIYEDLVCGRRIRPSDVPKLLALACEKRGYYE